MKTLLTISMLFLFQITGAQTLNLQAETMRMRHQNQRGDWTAWDTSKCDVPIVFSREMNICTIGNAQDMTFSINDRGPNSKWYESMDYEGRKLVIVLYENPDRTYNIMVQYVNVYDSKGLLYPGYAYQYIHCQIVK